VTPVREPLGTPHYLAPEVVSGGNATPLSDLYSLGIVLHEMLAGSPPFEGRDSDVAGLGIAYVQVGNHTTLSDRDSNTFNGTNQPVRDSETFLEATYQCQVTPWWQVQGSVQYTLNPGAGAVNPNDAAQTSQIPNAWVLGLRTNITF